MSRSKHLSSNKSAAVNGLTLHTDQAQPIRGQGGGQLTNEAPSHTESEKMCKAAPCTLAAWLRAVCNVSDREVQASGEPGLCIMICSPLTSQIYVLCSCDHKMINMACCILLNIYANAKY